MRTIFIFSGAGLSAESGIPTFRDSNGLWHNHRVEDVASPEGWKKDKQTVLDFYRDRFNSIKDCQPNPAHYAIAKLEEKFNVVNFTQNIDDLLERAGCTNVTHIHGTINQRKCEWHQSISDDPRFSCNHLEEQSEPVKLGDKCPVCMGAMRPNVVWFTENVHMDHELIREYGKEVKYNNGVFICVGTTAQVYPAGYLVPLFSQVKNKYIVDKNPIKVSDYTLIAGEAGCELPQLVEQLLKEENND